MPAIFFSPVDAIHDDLSGYSFSYIVHSYGWCEENYCSVKKEQDV